MKIFNLGSLNIDHVYAVSHFVRPGETLSADRLQIFPGGKGLNQSVALAHAGARPIHGGLIGSDGAFLRTVLADAGVDTAFVRTVDVPTGHAVIQVDESGQNCILLFAGANHAWSEAFVREVLHDAQPGDLLLLQNEIDALPVIFTVAKEKGLSIAFNPSPFDKRLSELPLELVTWWLVNELECAALTGEHDPQRMADALIARYPHSRLVLTLGGDGCLYRDSEKAVRQPAFPVRAVDTTAAGDTFTGFFLAQIAAGKPVEAALRTAAAAAAIAVSRPGASCSIPTLAEAEHAVF